MSLRFNLAKSRSAAPRRVSVSASSAIVCGSGMTFLTMLAILAVATSLTDMTATAARTGSAASRFADASRSAADASRLTASAATERAVHVSSSRPRHAVVADSRSVPRCPIRLFRSAATSASASAVWLACRSAWLPSALATCFQAAR